MHAQIGHTVGLHVDVYAACALSVCHGLCHPVNIADLAADHIRVPSGLIVPVAVERERVEHSVHVSVVIQDHDLCRCRQSGLCVIDLTAEHVPFLLGSPVRSSGLERDSDDGHVVE